MLLDNNQKVFFELLRAGLFPGHTDTTDITDGISWGSVNWEEVYRLATEQSVLGLVLAGLEHSDVKPPKELLLQWIGEVQVIEQRNKEMNAFIADLIEKLRKEDVYAILVKGQGIAQCYEKPLWRCSGDIDLLLSDSNYDKAKEVLLPLVTNIEQEFKHLKHLGMTIKGWVVELHGTLHSRLSRQVDRMIDEVQKDVFYYGNVRSWDDDGTQVFLPSPDNDVIFVFTHILHHFYIEGVGLRQICDWCRLLWTYKDSLKHGLLESRIWDADLMSEWRAFYALATKYLGMPEVPSFMFQDSSDPKWERKADRIMEFVMETGNFGHNRHNADGKLVSLWQKTKDFARHAQVFPLDSIKFYFHFVWDGLRIVMK